MTSKKKIGGLKQAREQYQLTQQDLAEKLGVSQQTIARWERKGGEVPTKYLKDLAVFLGCRVDALLDRPFSTTIAEKRREKEQEEEQAKDLPYGTLRLVFGPSTRPSDESEWNGPPLHGQVTHEYPISERTRSLVYGQMGNRNVPWVVFKSLDDRTVLVNTRQLLSLEMIGDDVEATPPFHHEEVYKAVAELVHSDFLETGEMPSDVGGDSGKYSRKLLKQCWELIQEWNGSEGTFEHLHGVVIETVEGHRTTLVNSEPLLFSELEGLLDELVLSANSASSMDEWMVDLYSEGYDRATFVRLGALRLVEVSTVGMATILEEEEEQDIERTEGSH
jgi:transcriptional regulator with XRE-family HTH domain